MNPTEQGTPAWGPPTGPDLGIQQAQQANGCPLLQNPLFWILAIGVIVWMCSGQQQKESEIDDE